MNDMCWTLERGKTTRLQSLEHCQFYVTNKYDSIWEGVLLYWSGVETYNVSVEGHNVHLHLYTKFTVNNKIE
jgi:hypothetical protein